jgi:hypothetical protein
MYSNGITTLFSFFPLGFREEINPFLLFPALLLLRFRSVQFGSGQFRSVQIRSDKIRSGQIRSGQIVLRREPSLDVV